MMNRWKKRCSRKDKVSAARSKRWSADVTMEEGPHSGDASVSGINTSCTIPETTEAEQNTSLDNLVSADLPELTHEQILERIDDWVVSLPREDKMMLCTLLYETFQGEFGLGILQAAAKVSSIVHHSERTVRRWRDEFRRKGNFPESRVGKYARLSIIDDEEVRRKAALWQGCHSYGFYRRLR